MSTINTTTVRQVLASGQTELALQQLLQLTEQANPETRESAVLLRAAWEYQEQQAIGGVLSFEEANVQRNRINQGALSLLADMESDGSVSASVQQGLQSDLHHPQVAMLMQAYDNKRTTTLQDTHIRADDGSSVIIGEGNTVHKKTYNALGIRQFSTILLAIVVLGGGSYFIYRQLSKGQDTSIASLSDIRKELGVLADLNKNLGEKLKEDRPEIENLLEKGLAAIRDKDYSTSVQYLEKAAETAPASTIYQNIAYAYEQMGNTGKAQENLSKAKAINPNLTVQKSASALKGKRVNLIAPENGGKLLASTSEDILKLTDGDLRPAFVDPQFGVFSFKDGKKAKFDQFETYLPRTGGEFQIELFYGNDSPTGNFTSIGVFKPYNGLLADTPFQQFKFPAVTAKYFKIQKEGWADVYEVKLLGVLE